MEDIRKRAIALVVGIIVGAIVMAILQGLAYRFLLDFDIRNISSLDASEAPVLALIALAVSYTFGAWSAIATGLKISGGWRFIAVLIGGLFLIGALLNYLSIPYPFWFLLVLIPAVVVGIAIPIRRMKD
ncbi:MAG: hypothetical protein MK078_12665 [Crocinitomicaceae bacterium]|nr:hypothetical protein [Crocinitomicaceae bacterium]